MLLTCFLLCLIIFKPKAQFSNFRSNFILVNIMLLLINGLDFVSFFLTIWSPNSFFYFIFYYWFFELSSKGFKYFFSSWCCDPLHDKVQCLCLPFFLIGWSAMSFPILLSLWKEWNDFLQQWEVIFESWDHQNPNDKVGNHKKDSFWVNFRYSTNWESSWRGMPSTLAVLKRQLSYRDCYKFNVDVKEGWVNHVPNGIGVMLLNDKSYSSQSSQVWWESKIQISIVSYN